MVNIISGLDSIITNAKKKKRICITLKTLDAVSLLIASLN